MEIAIWIAGYVAVGALGGLVAGFMRGDYSVVPLMLLWPVGIPLVIILAAFEYGETLNTHWRNLQYERERANAPERKTA